MGARVLCRHSCFIGCTRVVILFVFTSFLMLWIVSVPTGGVYCASRAEVRTYHESERAMNQGEQHDASERNRGEAAAIAPVIEWP